MNIAAILKNIDNSVLTEETATAIAEAFEQAVNEKVSSQIGLEVEKAVNELDQDHASKLKKLLEAVDKDHTEKLQLVVNSINENHAGKLLKIVNFYKSAINEKAEQFSNKIVEEMSNYLDLYLDKVIPQEQLQEAVANTTARHQLSQIKKIVSFDPSSINEDIKRVVLNSKSKIEELQSKLNESFNQNLALNEEVKNTKAALLLEQKTKGLPSAKKDFVVKILSDKTTDYIEENFSYVVEMFEREDRSISKDLAKQASSKAITKDAKVPSPSAPTQLNESVKSSDKPTDSYLSVLKSF